MSVRVDVESFWPAELVTDDEVGLVRASAASDSEESDSSDELLSLSLFSDPLEASAVGVPARPKKRLWNRCGAVPFVVDVADAELAADDVPAVPKRLVVVVAVAVAVVDEGVDVEALAFPNLLLVVVVAIVADAESPFWLPVLERRPVLPD